MPKEPLVSIITPVHNMENFLEETAKSVFAQTYSNWEWILIDDVSTDKTAKIIKGYENKDPRIKPIFLKEKLSAGRLRNIGVDNISGKFVAFLDGDDLWFSNKLERQIDFMLANNYQFTYTAYEHIREDSQPNGNVLRFKKKKSDFQSILKSCSVGCSTVILHFPKEKIYLENIPPGMRLCHDLMYWLCVLKKIPNAYYLDEVLMKYRLRSSAVSRNKIKQIGAQWRVYRDFVGLDFFNSLYHFSFYAILGLLKNYWPYRKNIPW